MANENKVYNLGELFMKTETFIDEEKNKEVTYDNFYIVLKDRAYRFYPKEKDKSAIKLYLDFFYNK